MTDLHINSTKRYDDLPEEDKALYEMEAKAILEEARAKGWKMNHHNGYVDVHWPDGSFYAGFPCRNANDDEVRALNEAIAWREARRRSPAWLRDLAKRLRDS